MVAVVREETKVAVMAETSKKECDWIFSDDLSSIAHNSVRSSPHINEEAGNDLNLPECNSQQSFEYLLIDEFIQDKDCTKPIDQLNPEIENSQAPKRVFKDDLDKSMVMMEDLTDRVALAFLKKLNEKIARLSYVDKQ